MKIKLYLKLGIRVFYNNRFFLTEKKLAVDPVQDVSRFFKMLEYPSK